MSKKQDKMTLRRLVNTNELSVFDCLRIFFKSNVGKDRSFEWLFCVLPADLAEINIRPKKLR